MLTIASAFVLLANTVKEIRTGKEFGREFEYKMPFHDWEDDIVTE